MDTLVIVSVLGSVASLAGLVVAGLQTIRFREFRRRTNTDIWLAVRTVRATIIKLETGNARKDNQQVAEVYGKLTELFCHLIRQAALDEKEFTEETIQKWRAAGKLTSDWQEAQARQFLTTQAISRLNLRQQDRAKEPDNLTLHNPLQPTNIATSIEGTLPRTTVKRLDDSSPLKSGGGDST